MTTEDHELLTRMRAAVADYCDDDIVPVKVANMRALITLIEQLMHRRTGSHDQ
jgi:hypothetical protein